MYSRIVRIEVRLSRKHVYHTIQELNRRGTPFTLDDISERAQCSRSTIIRAIRDLCQAGRLKYVPGQGQNCSQYEVIDEQSV